MISNYLMSKLMLILVCLGLFCGINSCMLWLELDAVVVGVFLLEECPWWVSTYDLFWMYIIVLEFIKQSSLSFLVLSDIDGKNQIRHYSIIYNDELAESSKLNSLDSLLAENQLLDAKLMYVNVFCELTGSRSNKPMVYQYNVEYSRKRLNPFVVDLLKKL